MEDHNGEPRRKLSQAEKERQRAMTPEERLQELLRLNAEKYGREAMNGRVERVLREIDLEDLG